MYHLTRPGMEPLHRAAQELSATPSILNAFLSRYSEFASLERSATRTE